MIFQRFFSIKSPLRYLPLFLVLLQFSVISQSGDSNGTYSTFKVETASPKGISPLPGSSRKMSPPVINSCSATLTSPTEVRLDYTISDPDNDLRDPVVTLDGNGSIREIHPDYAIIQSCLDMKLKIILTVEDLQGQKATTTREITTGPRHATADGYEWVRGDKRDDLINKRFPDFKVCIEIRDRPGNEKGTLTDNEIKAGVKLGLYAWASILPDLHIRFIDSAAKADFKIVFRQINYRSASGISSLAWNGRNAAEIGIDIDDIAFRQLDFVSPRMKFERAKAVFDRNKNVWSYYDEVSGDYTRYCHNYTDGKAAIKKAGKNPEKICIDWECIHWNEIPHAAVMGKGREGYHDLAWLVQHEFGHTLGLGHVDMDDISHKSSCAPLSCLPDQRTADRWPVAASTEKYWIPRAGLRRNKLPGITAASSPSVMIGNVWGVGTNNIRGVFDLDADALSTGEADECTCNGMIDDGTGLHGFRGYNVCYPILRTGWLIRMKNKKTKVEFYTNDWHAAHDTMGWVNNENTRPLATEWFLVDILDEKEAAAKSVSTGKMVPGN